jgi:hypothetical protein
MLGQRRVEPTTASLLLSPENVFSMLAGWLILGQKLTPRELFGCALVFVAVLSSQLPWAVSSGRGSGFRRSCLRAASNKRTVDESGRALDPLVSGSSTMQGERFRLAFCLGCRNIIGEECLSFRRAFSFGRLLLLKDSILVVSIGRHTRLGDALETALDGLRFQTIEAEELETADCADARVLFAASADPAGGNEPMRRLTARLLRGELRLCGAVCAMIADGEQGGRCGPTRSGCACGKRRGAEVLPQALLNPAAICAR